MTVIENLQKGGTVRPITRWGTPVLHRPTRPVTEFDEELLDLVRDMFATMSAAEGVGLAANQIGVDLAVFVYDCPDDDHVRHSGVFCNPTVTLPEGKDRVLDAADEGCLSLPGAYQELSRPDHAVCRGQDETGADVEVIRDRSPGPVPAARDRSCQRHGLRRPPPRPGAQEAVLAARGPRRQVPGRLARVTETRRLNVRVSGFR